jgi:hypothetical protein
MIKLKDLDASKAVLVIPEHKRTSYSVVADKFDETYLIKLEGLTYAQMKANIDKFFRYATARPTTTFWVVNFGAAVDFAPMFAHAPYNCVLSNRYRDIMGPEKERRWWIA